MIGTAAAVEAGASLAREVKEIARRTALKLNGVELMWPVLRWNWCALLRGEKI